jgi:hypothetical protein
MPYSSSQRHDLEADNRAANYINLGADIVAANVIDLGADSDAYLWHADQGMQREPAAARC